MDTMMEDMEEERMEESGSEEYMDTTDRIMNEMFDRLGVVEETKEEVFSTNCNNMEEEEEDLDSRASDMVDIL